MTLIYSSILVIKSIICNVLDGYLWNLLCIFFSLVNYVSRYFLLILIRWSYSYATLTFMRFLLVLFLGWSFFDLITLIALIGNFRKEIFTFILVFILFLYLSTVFDILNIVVVIRAVIEAHIPRCFAKFNLQMTLFISLLYWLILVVVRSTEISFTFFSRT